MKLLITGSRKAETHDYPRLEQAIARYAPMVQVILHGGARGADQLAGRYAREHRLQELVIRPDYYRYAGHLAPLMRNRDLVAQADGVIALYKGGRSGGTWHTAQLAQRAGKLLVELFDDGDQAAGEQIKLL